MNKIQNPAAVYVAKHHYLDELCAELGQERVVIDDLVFSPMQKRDACFAQDIWLNPIVIPFQSISEAVKILKQAGKYWYLHPIECVRRSRLIEQQLRKLPPLARSFPISDAIPPLGVFSLLDHNTLIYSSKRLKKWPQGHCFFIEDKINPPNRAYLKLWEALSLLEKYPKPGETVLDLGASPGGWTYVMQSLGALVTAVDKAELDEKIAQCHRVKFIKQSAFAYDPNSLQQPFDWVLSDVICYPDKTYNLVKNWIDSGNAKQLIVTIKMQGQTDREIIRQFQAIPNSSVVHLYHNKHEATFIWPSNQNKLL